MKSSGRKPNALFRPDSKGCAISLPQDGILTVAPLLGVAGIQNLENRGEGQFFFLTI
jgi:hypothetical protein